MPRKTKEERAFEKLTRELEKLVAKSEKMRFYMQDEILEMTSDGKIRLINTRGNIIQTFDDHSS